MRNLAAACGWLAWAQAAWAQAAATKVAEADGGVEITWKWMVESGGWIMYPLLALSVLGLALIIYLFVVLRVAQVTPLALQRELVEKIQAGAMDDARRACQYRPCPLSAVALSAMEYLRNLRGGDPVLLKDVMEGEGARQAESIQGQAQYLLDLAVISPMVGLFGTVWGMTQAFRSLALDIASAKPVVLAAGVSQALVTTVAGLMVGIPAMLFYSILRRRASRMVSYLESASSDLLTVLHGQRQGK